ncbi:MAG: hypothetical protein U9P79_04670, partial [Candidatus Cloacimonadota bacterium]|nr:hypothetical protein [Candidatus Cloacimonadota bacterium]
KNYLIHANKTLAIKDKKFQKHLQYFAVISIWEKSNYPEVENEKNNGIIRYCFNNFLNCKCK